MHEFRGGRRAGLQAVWLAASAAAIGGLAWFGLRPGGWLRPAPVPGLAGAVVQRGPLRISVTERGNLSAADSTVLKSQIEGQTTILWLIDEGTSVSEGELVCELDVTQQIDERFQREIAVRNAEAAYVKAKQSFEIQKSQNESDIAAAEQNLAFARQDLVKFQEGERAKLVKEAEEEITLAEEEAARAEEKLRWSTELESKGFLTSTELEADRLSANRAGILLEQARRDRDLLMKFELARQEDELLANLAEAERELERVVLQATARLVDFEAAVSTEQAKLELEKTELADLNEQIAHGKLYAPQSGMVVYARESGDRYGRDDPIAEGTQVRERQELITIPSTQGMVAEVSLHESVLKQVSPGLTCTVRIDAIPGREFHGRVAWVALLPDQNSWWANPNQRLYRTDVHIEDATEEMRPGMSCSVEILVEDIDDALYAPVQAVVRHRGENVAFVHSPAESGQYEVRPVVVGSYNDRWVEIEDGLAAGEIVLLAPPPDFVAEAEAEEAEAEGTGPGTPGASPGAPPLGAPPAGAPPAGVRPTSAPGTVGAPARDGPASASAVVPLAESQREAQAPAGGARPTAEQIEAWKRAREADGEGPAGVGEAAAARPAEGAASEGAASEGRAPGSSE